MVAIVVANVGQDKRVWEVLFDYLSGSLQVGQDSIPSFRKLCLRCDLIHMRGNIMRNVIACYKKQIDFTERFIEVLQHIRDKRRRRIAIDATDRGVL